MIVKYFDSKVKPNDFKEDDLVYLYSPELVKINRKIQSAFIGPYLLQHKIGLHNVVLQNLKTHRTKLVHIDRIRKANLTFSNLGRELAPTSPTAQSKNSVDNKQSAESRQGNKNVAADSEQFKKNAVAGPELVDFDLKNEIVWHGNSLPAPIPIKTEDEQETPSFESGVSADTEVHPSPEQTLSPSQITTSPAPSSASSSTSKVKSNFPSPAKIGSEFVDFFSRPKTRAATKAADIVLPSFESTAPPAVCPTKTKTVETQAKKKLSKLTKKK